MSDATPYLSIVAVGRNDNYGQHFGQRLQTFLRQLGKLSRGFPNLFELVFVEWNPPPDRPSLKDAFDWSGLAQVRIITVPADIHDALPNTQNTPMFEYFAKNVGVRRARGAFILATNPDIIFSDELFAFFAQRTLNPHTFYRVDRHDCHPLPCFDASTDALYQTARHHVFKVEVRHGRDAQTPISIPVDGLPIEAWEKSTPWDGDIILDPAQFISLNRKGAMAGLHCNGAGDFFLAHRDAWHAIKAYAQRPQHRAHLDGLIVAYARASGLLQIILTRPYYIIHMDHDRSQAQARPDMPYAVIEEEFKTVEKFGSLHQNPDDWGYAQVTLPEWSPA